MAPPIRAGLGLPAALVATWAAIPLVWIGLPPGGPGAAALAAVAMAAAALLAVTAAALVRRRLGASRWFPAAFTAAVTLVGAGAALAALAVAGRVAGAGAGAWPVAYGPAIAFVSLVFVVPHHLWARARLADAAAAGVAAPADGAVRPLWSALFEWLAVAAALAAFPLADRAARLGGLPDDRRLAVAAPVVAAVAVAAALAAVVAIRARRGIAPRVAAIDAVPEASPEPAAAPAVAEIAELDAVISGLGERYAAELEAQGELIEARRLTRENKAKVFASMSHDLRGPLNSIIGFSDLLLKGIDGELSGEQRSTVIEISREAERLLVLTGDILDTAKLDAGRFELDRVWVPTGAVLAACEEGAARFTAPKGVAFRTSLKDGLPPVLVDKERLVGALLGLVSRVADAMTGGRLHLFARQMTSLEEGRDYVLFELFDEERRVDPAWRERAFDVFASLEGVAISGENGGLTLGLNLAERIVLLHDGELAVSGEVDEPVFTVALGLDREAGGG
jgi:signal transduction histidine kinase